LIRSTATSSKGLDFTRVELTQSRLHTRLEARESLIDRAHAS
jgi:hypothetical protein